MATIAQIVEQIRHAVFGKDVRENIAQGIEKCYQDSTASAQISSIVQAGQETIASIPEDYSALSAKAVENEIDIKQQIDIGLGAKNFCFPSQDSSRTTGGITWTESGNTVHAVGTASWNVNYYLQKNLSFPEDVDYIYITGCPGDGYGKYEIILGDWNESAQTFSSLVIESTGTGSLYKIDHSKVYCINLRILSGATVDVVFTPIVIDKRLYDKNAVVNIAGNNSIVSLPYNSSDYTESYGITWTRRGNKVHASGTATGNVNYYFKTNYSFDPKIKTIYYSGCPKYGSRNTYALRIGKYRSDGSGTSGWTTVAYDFGDGVLLDVQENSTYCIICSIFSGATVDIWFDPILVDYTDKNLNEIRKTLYDHEDFYFIKTVKSGAIYHGDCVLIDGEKKGLIDFGYDESCASIISVLNESGINKLDYVIISHYHSDHITADFATAMNSLIEAGIDFSDCIFYLPHKDIDWSQFIGNNDKKETAEQNVISKLNSLEISYIWPNNKQQICLTNDLNITFYNIGSYDSYYGYTLGMNLNETGYTNYNSFSMVAEINSFGNRFLMSGDITPIAQEKIAGDINDCEVYKVEHHGINIDASIAFLNKLNPKYVVIEQYSDNYNTLYNLGRPTIKYFSVNSEVYNTLDGNVKIRSQKGEVATIYSGTSSIPIKEIAVASCKSKAFIDEILKVYDQSATPIESTNGYLETTGKYYVLNGICYFSVLVFYEYSVSSGLNNVFSLPLPDDIHINNRYYGFDEYGNASRVELLYNTEAENWRLRGTQSSNRYILVYGAYKVSQVSEPET